MEDKLLNKIKKNPTLMTTSDINIMNKRSQKLLYSSILPKKFNIAIIKIVLYPQQRARFTQNCP